MAQELARHSDIRLTMNVYTNAELYDLAGAVEGLPSILSGADRGAAALAASVMDLNEPVRRSGEDRKVAMSAYLTSSDGPRRIRAHVLLLLDDGHAASMAQRITFTEAEEVAEVIRLFREGGVAAVLGG